MTKTAIRRRLRAELRGLSPQERSAASAAIREALLAHPAVGEARCIAVFDPLADEPDIAPLRHALPGARIVFPRREGGTLALHQVDDAALLLQVAGHAFREPDPGRCPRIALAEIDTILVPGLAFSRSGDARLGRGGGYYDRLLADPALRGARLGVCFALQLRDDVPREAHDRGVDEVVTERRI